MALRRLSPYTLDRAPWFYNGTIEPNKTVRIYETFFEVGIGYHRVYYELLLGERLGLLA